MQIQPNIQVGQLPNSEQSLPSKQILRAPGRQVQFGGRPVDLALSPDGRTVFIKNMTNLLVMDTISWSLLQTLAYPRSGASMHGIATSKDGSHVYVSGAGTELYDWVVGPKSGRLFQDDLFARRLLSLWSGGLGQRHQGLRVPFHTQHIGRG
jgi:hypothetical protein